MIAGSTLLRLLAPHSQTAERPSTVVSPLELNMLRQRAVESQHDLVPPLSRATFGAGCRRGRKVSAGGRDSNSRRAIERPRRASSRCLR